MILSFQHDQLKAVLEFVTTEAEDPADVVRAQRLPFVACELICTWPVYEKMLEDEELVGTLLQPFRGENVNLLLLGYLSRILRSLSSSSHSTNLQALLYAPEGYMQHLLRHTYSFSIAELLVTLLTSGDNYKDEKREIVLKLIDLAQMSEIPMKRYHCSKAIVEILEQAEAYQSARELATVIVSDKGLELLQKGVQPDRMDVSLLSLQLLKTVIQSKVLRAILQSSEQSLPFYSIFPGLIASLDTFLRFGLNTKLPAETISTALSLLRALAKLDLPCITEALIAHGTLHTCTQLFLSSEFPSFISTQYALLAETICPLSSLREHFIHSTGIQALILEAVQSPMIS